MSITLPLAVSDYLLIRVWIPIDGPQAIVQAWTLCNEAAFYLLLPFVAFWLGKRGARREAQLLVLVIGLGLLLRLLVMVAGDRVGFRTNGVLLLPFLNAHFFAGGMRSPWPKDGVSRGRYLQQAAAGPRPRSSSRPS